jgi:hypothetical protein
MFIRLKVFDRAFFQDFIHMESVGDFGVKATKKCVWSGMST